MKVKTSCSHESAPLTSLKQKYVFVDWLCSSTEKLRYWEKTHILMWDQQTTGAREPPPKSPQKATKTANKGQSSYTEACIYLAKL